MRSTNFTDFRNSAKDYFQMVEEGETVRILRNNKPIADLVPVHNNKPSWKKTGVPFELDLSISDEVIKDRSSNI